MNYQEALDREVERVFDEIANGQHWLEIYESSCFDSDMMAKIAYEEAMMVPHHLRDTHARANFELQLSDYARDVAERRISREDYDA